MKKKAKQIPHSSANPFADSQARNYSGEKILSEFCPISKYWSLFNDQHEILVGTKGCGKTLLLKMMRYSMLSKLSDCKAKELACEKRYIAFYVPLHLEYIKKLSNSALSKDAKISWFRFSFNCLLAQSIIIETAAILDDLERNDLNRIKLEYSLSKLIDSQWGIAPETPVFQFARLREKVDRLYYSVDPLSDDLSSVPNAFKHSLAASLSSIRSLLCDKLKIDPTWIVCIDEAEFADECYQECINTALRADTGRIAFKMATLHFYHKTKSTLDENITVMDGQDFKYTLIDMQSDEDDFKKVTDSLIKTRLRSENLELLGLKDFLETIGKDQYIDYFSKQMNCDKYPRELLDQQILAQLSEKSKILNAEKSPDERRKPVSDKLRPIFYLREMYKISKKGASKPGWFAGATMIRRIAQGNPRLFIRIMNALFDQARGKKLPLPVSTQHEIMMDFATSFCGETQTLEQCGPIAKKQLDYISNIIQKQAHSDKLVQSGVTFKLNSNTDVSKHKDWIEKAVAFSRLMIDDQSLLTQVSSDTTFYLSNIYAVAFWLPMRSLSSPLKISLLDDVDATYPVKRPNAKKNTQHIDNQLTLFSHGGYHDAHKE